MIQSPKLLSFEQIDINQYLLPEKLRNILIARKCGFNVPFGIVLKVDREISLKETESFLTGIKDEVFACFNINDNLISRSCSQFEDHSNRSAAGIYQSINNLKRGSFVEGVMKTLSSYHSELARDYEKSIQKSQSCFDYVLIQKQITPVIIGICSTTSQFDSDNNILIEAEGSFFRKQDENVCLYKFQLDRDEYQLTSDIPLTKPLERKLETTAFNYILLEKTFKQEITMEFCFDQNSTIQILQVRRLPLPEEGFITYTDRIIRQFWPDYICKIMGSIIGLGKNTDPSGSVLRIEGYRLQLKTTTADTLRSLSFPMSMREKFSRQWNLLLDVFRANNQLHTTLPLFKILLSKQYIIRGYQQQFELIKAELFQPTRTPDFNSQLLLKATRSFREVHKYAMLVAGQCWIAEKLMDTAAKESLFSAIYSETRELIQDVAKTTPESDEQFETLLKKYSHKYQLRDLPHPRWEEDPAQFRELIKTLNNSQDLTSKSTNSASNTSNNYLNNIFNCKEKLRVLLDKYMHIFRKLLLELEVGLIDKTSGAITQGDVFHMSLQELNLLLEGVKDNISFKMLQDERKDYEFITTRGNTNSNNKRKENHLITGICAAKGSASGQVRYLHSVNEHFKFVDKDMIYADTIDPGWFPLLARSSGVIVGNNDGVLSHVMVLVRELGIPCLVNVGKIGEQIDGANIYLNADQRAIQIL